MILRLIALLVVEMMILAACQISGVAAGWSLAVHAVASAFGFGVWLRSGTATGFAPAVLGVFGPLGLLAALPLVRVFKLKTQRSDDEMFGPVAGRSAQRGARLAVARMLDGRVHHATPDTLSSLVTIMRHGAVAERRCALETVVRSFEPALSPLIALALTDGDQTIRALAAAASARVAENLVLARARLSARIADGADPDAATSLATLLADHARSDVLLSDSQRLHLREDAVATMVAAVPSKADDPGSGTRDALMMEALWAAGDYAAIDRMATAIEAASERNDTPMDATHRGATTRAIWWLTGAAA
ncbi:hypothetical protein C8J42_11033 [Sphingomonas sp. PP-CE-1A-559]|uniref:hypothetical protein n=1 Tax=Sphingomonas sp. PP-CE-1A-559 TaxID=2135657 RepID=UPI001054E41E|nr:hypothetical protein [Sphingomonas sp. PP-CE-1A-559]TCP87518.1 hypothetical protein C8J42_11033 [Sphingomonas sp. PP-CE-1A-559]